MKFMKNRSLPVKRNPLRKSHGIFRRLSAVTNRQRAATATAEDLELDESGSGVSKAITILFLIHVLAIGIFFVHQRFLNGSTPTAAPTKEKTVAKAPAQPRRENLPQVVPGEKSYIVKTGDNYARIAAAQGVDESELRAINNSVDIRPDLVLRIPPKQIVAELPAEVTNIQRAEPLDADRGLVEAVDVRNAPKAVLVKSQPRTETPETFRAAAKPTPAPAESKTAGMKNTHVLKQGENLWRVAAKYKTTPEALKKANNIKDERKLKPGLKLIVP